MKVEFGYNSSREYESNGQTFTPFPEWLSQDGNVQFSIASERRYSEYLAVEIKQVKINRFDVRVHMTFSPFKGFWSLRDISARRIDGTTHGTSDSFTAKAVDYVSPYLVAFVEQVTNINLFLNSRDELKAFNYAKLMYEHTKREFEEAEQKYTLAVDSLMKVVNDESS